MHRICLPAVLAPAALALVLALPSAVNAQDASRNPGYADALPEDFHGKVSYFGNYSGSLVNWKESEARRPAPECGENGRPCGNRIGGSLQVDLEFDGVVVRGSFRGSGGLHDSGLIGRRQGSQCRLFDLTDGSVWTGKCDREGFSGQVKSVPNASGQLSLNFEVVGTKSTDYAERDRLRREAQMQQRRIEFLRSVIASDDPVDDRILASVELDSFSWPYDRLRVDSMTIARHSRSRRGSYDVRVDFDLISDGSANPGRGWAVARVANGVISCIEFWDYPGKCRSVNAPPPPPVYDNYDDPSKTSSLMPRDLIIPRAAYGI